MYFSTSIVSSLLLAGGALAQYGGSGTASSMMSQASPAVATPMGQSLSSTAVQVQVVQVSNSNGALMYNPSTIFAAVGTLVQFQFNPMNHTVTQSTFGQPCVPIQNVMPSMQGFFSGFMPTKMGETQPVFTVMINDTNPIWFYCSQGKHCQKGMVGVINPPMNSNKTQASFAALAAMAPENLAPGVMGMGSSSTMMGSTATFTASSTMSTMVSNSSFSGGSTMTASSSIAVSTTSGALSRFVASRQSMAAAGLSFVAASSLLFL